jgi:predicted DNA-binding ArsR family transcriptional regulator
MKDMFKFETIHQPPNILKITKEQEKFIRENNTTMTPKELSDNLGLKYQHVYSFMRRNNIYKLKGQAAKKEFVENYDKDSFFDADNYLKSVSTI